MARQTGRAGALEWMMSEPKRPQIQLNERLNSTAKGAQQFEMDKGEDGWQRNAGEDGEEKSQADAAQGKKMVVA